MPARLICEPEESEEDEGNYDQRPAEKFQENTSLGVGLPQNAWNLNDSAIIVVGVGPAHPRDKTYLSVEVENPRRQWDSPEDLDHG